MLAVKLGASNLKAIPACEAAMAREIREGVKLAESKLAKATVKAATAEVADSKPKANPKASAPPPEAVPVPAARY